MRKLGIGIVTLMIFVSGCGKNSTINKISDNTVITKEKVATEAYNITKLNSLPAFDPNNYGPYQVDIRKSDLSDLNLEDKLPDLVHATFDTITRWPNRLPVSYNPEQVLEYGKNPGLGIRQLHASGINGKNIGIAIIDSVLLQNHIEYKDNIKFYKEMHSFETSPQMHGPGVASIAVGKTVGVAPEAYLYYIATSWENRDRAGRTEDDFTWLVKAIDEILKLNKDLAKNKKIRVISISVGVPSDKKGYKEFMQAINRAKQENIFVVSSSLKATYGYGYDGLDRYPLDDPEKLSSYKVIRASEKKFYENNDSFYSNRTENLKVNEILFVPMNSRSLASEQGINEYTFYSQGGWSWCSPYIAGLYALACQVNPNITTDIFWNTALETGDTLKIEKDNKSYELKKIINPQKLIESLKIK